MPGDEKMMGSVDRASIHQQTAQQVLGYNTIINPIPGYQHNPYFNGSHSTTPIVKNEKKGLF